jgi:hypothetical protein
MVPDAVNGKRPAPPSPSAPQRPTSRWNLPAAPVPRVTSCITRASQLRQVARGRLRCPMAKVRLRVRDRRWREPHLCDASRAPASRSSRSRRSGWLLERARSRLGGTLTRQARPLEQLGMSFGSRSCRVPALCRAAQHDREGGVHRGSGRPDRWRGRECHVDSADFSSAVIRASTCRRTSGPV